MGGTSIESTNTYDPVMGEAAMLTARESQKRANELWATYQSDFLPYDKQAMQANTEILNSMVDLTQQQIDLNQQVNPARADATEAAYKESLYDIQQGRGIRDAQRSAQLSTINDTQALSDKFYQEALNGITPQYEQRMGEATSDVAQAYATAAKDTSMSLARMGVDPTSGKALSALSGLGASRAKDIAAARTSARDTERARVEDTNWSRLTTGMNARQSALSGIWASDYGSVAAGGLPYMSGTTNFTPTSNPLSASIQSQGQALNAQTSMANRVMSTTETSSGDAFGGVLSGIATLGGAAIGRWSSKRFKTNITPCADATAFPALNPVSFIYKDDPEARPTLGFIAEELAKTLPEVVFFDDNGRPEAVDYGKLTVMLVLENRKLKGKVEELERVCAQ